jgi:preprotein translocase subunit YajC
MDYTTQLVFLLMGAAFYVLLIRPQQKRAKAQQAMTNSLQPGTRVMLTSGVLGTIKHLGERQTIIEVSPGVELTVVKNAVVRVLTADEDEFEYADSDESSDAEPGDLVEAEAEASTDDPYAPGTPDVQNTQK